MDLDEANFRGLLDARGVLRPGAPRALEPVRSSSLLVFGQRRDATLDLGALRAQASRFFRAKIGLTVDKRYGADPPETDAARVVLASDDGLTSGTRFVYGRRADSSDLAAAEQAERTQGTYGMALLAARCPTAWLIPTIGEDDRVALTIAAIFASVLLGPILAPDGASLFGVRTARERLERPPGGQPYRG
jgi:hypothetical protein